MHLPVTVSLAILFCGLAAPAQQHLQTMALMDFYWNYTPMGDVNGDGYEDVLVTSAIDVGLGSTYYDYELRIYSGKDASLIRLGPRWHWPEGGFAYAHGDQDHDGVRDYVCWERDGLANWQALSVRSGRDDHILWRIQHPLSMYWANHVVGNLDLNGDGELDVVVSHPLSNPGPSYGTIWAYDHHGNLLYQLQGPVQGSPPQYTLAQSLAKVGDVNGDGCDDYITGLGDPTWYGAVAVLSGPTGQILRIVTGQNYLDYIGSGCVGCGDLDGDNVPDFAAGGGLSGSWGSVQAFSGATGARLFTCYSGISGDHFGPMLEVGDYDNDGINDIVAATWAGLRVVSGREGIEIAHYAPTPGNWGAHRALPLRTPDGFQHVLVQTQAYGPLLLTSLPHRAGVLGPGCAITPSVGAAPRLGMRELNALDRRLTLSGAEPGSVAFLLLGLASASNGPTSLAPFGLPACSLYPDLQVLGGFTAGASGAAAGFANHDFTIPSPSAYDHGIDAQWLTLDANFAPAGLTSGMRFAIH